MRVGRLGVVVVHTIALMIVRRGLGVLGCGPTPNADAVDIAVLRHQVAVLHRQVVRPRYNPADRMVLAARAKRRPRKRPAVLLVTPRRCCPGVGNSSSAGGPSRLTVVTG